MFRKSSGFAAAIPDQVGRAQLVGALVYGVARDKRQPHPNIKRHNLTGLHKPERGNPKGENLSSFGALSPIFPEKWDPAGQANL